MANDGNIDELVLAAEILRPKNVEEDLEKLEETPLPEQATEPLPEFLKPLESQSQSQSQPLPSSSFQTTSEVKDPTGDPDLNDFIQPPLSPDTNWECKQCGKRAERVCPNCQGSYCLNCASFINPLYCQLCLSEGTIEVKTEPLVSTDGVTHAGRKLVPIGEAYKTLPKIVSEMTDQELEVHIAKYKMLAHKHGLAKTFCEVSATIGEFEQQGREHIKRKRRQSVKGVVSTSTGKTVSASNGKSNGKSASSVPLKIETDADAAKVAASMSRGGVSIKQLEELLALKRKLEGKN